MSLKINFQFIYLSKTALDKIALGGALVLGNAVYTYINILYNNIHISDKKS